jgi:cytochrome c-type biogenesis protein
VSTAAGSVDASPAPVSVRRELLTHSIVFVLGFTLVFVLAGASASAIGALFKEYQVLIARIIGVVIVLLGLNMMGLFRLPFLAMDKRLHFAHTTTSYPATFLVGIGFAAGWSPCIGPVLAAVFALAGSTASVVRGTEYLLVYSLGLGIPFIITALALNYVLPFFKRIKRLLPVAEFIGGLIVVGMGLVLVKNSLLLLIGFLYFFFEEISNFGWVQVFVGGGMSLVFVFSEGVLSFI